MGWYQSHYKECEYCGQGFEASREDAQFCSSKCRTANWRREKRREDAQEKMSSGWDQMAYNAYSDLAGEIDGVGEKIQDVYIEHGPDAAATAALLAHQVMHDILRRCEARIHEKEKLIEQLRTDRETLSHIRQIVSR